MGKTTTIKEGVSASYGSTDKGPMVSWSSWDRPTEFKYFSTIGEAEKFFNEKVIELKAHPKRPVDENLIKERIKETEKVIILCQERILKSRDDFWAKILDEEERHLETLREILRGAQHGAE